MCMYVQVPMEAGRGRWVPWGKLPSVVLEAEFGFPVRVSALSLVTVMTKPSR